MGKFVLVVVLALVVVWWLRSLRRVAPPSDAKPPAQPTAAQSIVPCAHCGVHLPRSEAVAAATSDQRYYCTEAHRLAAERR